jgi:hypothetical protein
MKSPLLFGALLPETVPTRHTSLRWLVASGSSFPAGTILAYCNISPAFGSGPALHPLAAEWRDLQLAFVLQHPGVVQYKPDAMGGGQIDRNVWRYDWHPEREFAKLMTERSPKGPLVRPLVVCGRRMSELAEVRDGLLTGWHTRKRAWWADAQEPGAVLAGLGSCEVTSIMQGSRPGMLDLLDGAAGGSQLLVIPDSAVVPCARTTLEQLRRTPSDMQAIRADMSSSLLALGDKLEARDWLMAGAIQASLLASPLTEPLPILIQGGARVSAPPSAVVMSLHAEPMRVFRHRRLGYTLAIYGYRLTQDTGPGLKNWLATAFEPVVRTPDDIRADFAELLIELRSRSVKRLLLANIFSSSISDDLPSYAGLDTPLSQSIGSVRAKECNLAMAELAAEDPGLLILDIDAMAADLGAIRVLPDSLHVAGDLQILVQQEIRRQLAASGIKGFAV